MKTEIVQIKNRSTGSVIFEAEVDASLSGELKIGAAVKIAIKTDANLAGANLAAANLAGANLADAYLAGANLAGANLTRADLAGADLADAYLAGANLDGANLDGANLAGAYLDGANLAGAKVNDGNVLAGTRPIFQIGPIGSRCAYLAAYITTSGVFVRAGCFFGSLAEFSATVNKTHGENEHGQEYNAAIQMIEAHAKIWGQKS